MPNNILNVERVDINVKDNSSDQCKVEKKVGIKGDTETTVVERNPPKLTRGLVTKKTVHKHVWNLVFTITTVSFHFLHQNLVTETNFEVIRNAMLGQIAETLAVANNCFNFCFYMRANSFRATIRVRWAGEYQHGKLDPHNTFRCSKAVVYT